MGKDLRIKNFKTKKTMKKMLFLFCMFSWNVQAQWLTNDPIHTGVSTLIKLVQDPSFKEIVKDIEKLKKVSSAVRQFHRGTEIIRTISGITTKLSQYSSAVAKDGHIFAVEYELMAKDVQSFAETGTNLIKDMKSATSASGGVLQMTDAERTEWINATYTKVKQFENLVDRYFGRISQQSLSRSKTRGDLSATQKLYTLAATVQPVFIGEGFTPSIAKNGYDAAYDDSKKSALDSATTNSPAARELKAKQEYCQYAMQQYSDEKQLVEMQMESQAFRELLGEGYSWRLKKKELNMQSVLSMNIFSVAKDTYDATGTNRELSTGGNNQNNLTTTIEEEVGFFIGPDGQIISNEKFMIHLRMKVREIMIRDQIDQKLREKWHLNDCNNLDTMQLPTSWKQAKG
jgi:hypothetical protein